MQADIALHLHLSPGKYVMAIARYLSIASLLTIVSIGHAEPIDAVIDRLAKPYVEADIIVGMTIGAIHGDEQAVRGFGRFSEDDSRTPDGKTVYEIGSVSKVFTGLLLADAVVEGD